MLNELKTKGLEYIPPSKIERNPENPRIFFDPKLIQELKESINELGILVPLIVYYDPTVGKYRLLDGERRWKCAQDLRLKEVPANIIAKPTRLQNILEMFNIHNVRIEWGPMEIAWKLKVIMDEFDYTKEKDLSRLTSLKPAEIRKSKILLSYNKKYQKSVHLGPKRGGIKEDFLIELNPSLKWIEKNLGFQKKEINGLINSLIQKHKKKIIVNYVKDFRNFSKILRSGAPKKNLKKIIQNLNKKLKYNINDAYEESVKYSVNVRDIERKSKRLIKILKEFGIKKDDVENKRLLDILLELKRMLDKIIIILQK